MIRLRNTPPSTMALVLQILVEKEKKLIDMPDFTDFSLKESITTLSVNFYCGFILSGNKPAMCKALCPTTADIVVLSLSIM